MHIERVATLAGSFDKTEADEAFEIAREQALHQLQQRGDQL